MKRNIYLKTLEIDEALEIARKSFKKDEYLQKEIIPSHQALHRVLSKPVYAKHSSPPYHCAAMDGFAVLAESTFMAREGEPLFLEMDTQCQAVNTGNPLKSDFNAVIMIENVVQKEGKNGIYIENPVFPYQHVRRIGEDIVATELLFPQNTLVKPWDIGALLSAGIWDVEVYEQLKVCIIPSGDEILDFMDKPEPKAGEVIESNSQLISALLSEIGCQSTRVKPVKDNQEALENALQQALDDGYHAIIFCAGSSAGSKDYTKSVIAAKGEVLIHGIAAMPGKPSLLGKCKGINGDRLIVGAPGYPVSTLVCIEELVIPLLCEFMQKKAPEKNYYDVELTRNTVSKLGTKEFIRLAVGEVDSRLVATPLSKGAGNITSVCRAQAVAAIPLNVEGVQAGQKISAKLTTHSELLENTIVCVGSHDNVLDLLHDELMKEGYAFTSSHVGSTGGITALKNKACHFAGMHLFDPETKTFNFPFLNSMLPEHNLTVINLVSRYQGLIVAKGNPLKINFIEDLKRVSFINRQKGSGTRILFDHKLEEAGMKPSDIDGYSKEEFTHMAVAANVLTNNVDCGMGIQAAAKALNLDFIPLALERYDIVIPTAYMDDHRIQKALEIIRRPEFSARINSLGGYETDFTGQIMQK